MNSIKMSHITLKIFWKCVLWKPLKGFQHQCFRFILIIILFNQQIADVMDYSDNKEYVLLFSLIITIDACTAIPFAKLRREERGLKFAMIKIVNVAVIIGLAIFFYVLAPKIYSKDTNSIISLVSSVRT